MIFPSEQMGVMIMVFLGFLILQCTAFDEHVYPKNESLKCWDCNSEYDYRCGDPFNNYTIGVMNCNEVKVEEHIAELFGTSNVQPRVCRKIVQRIRGNHFSIENRTRIIRGCGFLPDKWDNKKCVTRSGTKDVNVQYCACTTSFCNVGHSEMPPFISIVVSILVTLSLCFLAF